MPEPTSFFYLPDDERLEEWASRFDKLTDVFGSSDVSSRPQVAMVSWDAEHVEACAVMAPSGAVASYKTRVRLTHFFVTGPVMLKDLGDRLPHGVRGRFRRAVSKGGQLDTKTTAAVKATLDEHYPDAAEAWESAEAEANRPTPELWPDEGVPTVAYEREAVGLALALTGIDGDDVMGSWRGNTAAPFLDGLEEFRVYEDSAIAHDTRVFGNWDAISGSVIGIAEFGDALGRKVTVVNANRTPIEKTLGCDLVYYMHDFNAYVLVQYKRLTKATRGWEFRPSADSNFEDELKRMREIAQPGRVKDEPEHYRLGDNFCFIKFCKPETKKPFSRELASGMYLPLDYFDSLVRSNRLRGPRGGTVLTHENAERWLNNSAFIGLVERSWVGARGLTSTQLTRVLRRSLAAKHSLMLAEGNALPPGPHPS